jgi:RNA polymerase sigma factor (sigma-70 family)
MALRVHFMLFRGIPLDSYAPRATPNMARRWRMDLVQAVTHSAGPLPGSAGRRRRLAREEQREVLAEAINELSETERLVLGMRCLESVRPRQIAVLLEMSEEKVNALLQSGLRVIQEHVAVARSAPPPLKKESGSARGGGRGR